MKKHFEIYALPLAVTILAVAIAVVGIQFISVKKTEVENQARFQCAQSSHYEVTNKEGVTTWYPIKDLYEQCLKDKGL